MLVWFCAHIPFLNYGTDNLPLHMSYVGDEQSPVSGALHVLQDKNPLALRNLSTVYYGPVFSMISLPGVLSDFIYRMFTGDIHSIGDYKDYILWNWGGIAKNDRFIAVFFGLIGIVSLFKLLSTDTINPLKRKLPVYLGVALLSLDLLYFEYTGFFKHWAIIIPLLILQFYFLVRLKESGYSKKYWILSAFISVFSFGVSYLSILFQIMWLPLLINWIRDKNIKQLKQFCFYTLGFIVSNFLIVLWHPHAFLRIIGIIGGDITDTSIANYTNEIQVANLPMSFSYYLSIILNNYLAVLLVAIILSVFLFYKNNIHKLWYLWSILSVVFASFVIFGIVSHHESRYVLPVTTGLIVFVSVLLSIYFSGVDVKNKFVSVIIFLLISFTILFNFIHIIKLDFIINEGPKERVVVNRILELEKQKVGSKTLSYQYYILGAVHTKEAYSDYASRTKKDNLNLYKIIASTTLPKNITPLNVYYRRPDSGINVKEWNDYDHVVYKFEPRQEINQFDFFDESYLRLWKYDDLSVKYFFIK